VATDQACWPEVVPVGFFGDGVGFSKNESAMSLSWNSIISEAHNVLDSRFLIGVLPTSLLLPGTIRQILQVVAWSFAVMFSGKHPETDERLRPWPEGSPQQVVAGTPLGSRAALVDCRGDWSFQSAFWGLPYWNQDPCCLRCLARQSGPLTWANCGPTAPWRRAPLTTAVFLGHFRPGTMNPLALVPSFHIEAIKFDETHAVKLGVARIISASALLDLCDRGHFGGRPLANQLSAAWNSFKQWLRRGYLHSNLRRFTASRLNHSTTEYPELAAKAWNCRLVVGWLASQACAAADAPQSEHNRMVALAVYGLNDMFCTMEGAKRFFDQAQADRFCNNCDDVLGALTWLAKESLDEKRLRWPLRPKMHVIGHLQEQVRSDFRNPKYYACMLDEDFIGVTVRMAKHIHRRSVATATMVRYIIRLKQRWSVHPQNVRKVMPRTRRDRPLKACM